MLQNLLGLLPFLCLVCLVAAFHERSAGRAPLRSLLSAALAWGLIFAISTEALSALDLIGLSGILGVWIGVGIGAAIAVIYATRPHLETPASRSFLLQLAEFSRFEIGLIAAIMLLAGTTLLIAVTAPPNTWDSMTYHMARIPHWIQNASLDPYPTPIFRQLNQPPLAEFMILHLQVLSGGDRYANLVQWISMIGTVIAGAEIAGQLGAPRPARLIAGLVAASLPMGILQASSTQNDWIAALWMCCLALYALDALKEGINGRNAAGFGASLALATLTKGTTYFFALPFVAMFGWLMVRQTLPRVLTDTPESSDRQLPGRRWAIWQLALAGVGITILVIGINASHLARNQSAFGSLLGPTATYSNESIGAGPLLSNAVRGIGSNVIAPGQGVQTWIEQFIEVLHRPLGLATNDPRTTFFAWEFVVPLARTWIVFDEDIAANPLHTGLAMAALLLVFTRSGFWLAAYLRRGVELSRQGNGRAAFWLSTMVLSGYATFCLLVKWHPYITRLQLPLFALCAPLIADVLLRPAWQAGVDRMQRLAAITLIVLMVINGLPYLLLNLNRPLLPRWIFAYDHGRHVVSPRLDQYFAKRPDLQEPYEEAVDIIQGADCREVGLVIGNNTFEYPLWVLLGDKAHIEHMVSIAPNRPADAGIVPCAVIVVEPDGSIGDVIDARYRLVYLAGAVRVFAPVPSR